MSLESTVNLEKLRQFDIKLVIDGSGSMDLPVKAGSSKTRWKAMQESVMQFAKDAQKIDANGIDIVLFNRGVISTFTNSTPEKLIEIFQNHSPAGGTPLAEAIKAALDIKSVEKKNFTMVYTDGVPDDDQALTQVIINEANSIQNDDDSTILCAQVGDDADATKYLQSVDEKPAAAQFDIFDTKTVAEVDKFGSLIELINHAIND